MGKTASDVLAEWVLRGYITSEESTTNAAKYMSYIEQAKTDILTYCRLPLNIQDFPAGLFYVWVEIAWGLQRGGQFNGSTGGLKVTSVKEGDTTVQFGSSSGINSLTSATATTSYADALNRFRRLF